MMTGILANSAGDAAAFFRELTATLLNPWSVLIYITISAVILFLFARTRLATLYVVKTAWISVTAFAFLWVVITSMGSNRQYVQHPEQAISQFLNPSGLILVGLVAAVGLFGWKRGGGVYALLFHVALAICYAAKLAAHWAGDPILALAGSAVEHFRAQPVSSAVGTLALGVLAFIPALGRLMPAREFEEGRKRVVLVIRIAMGTCATLALLVAAHANGYDRWTDNYATALLVARMGEYAANSILITIGSVAITVCCASMAAFALSKLDFFGRDAFLYTFIAGFAIPGQLILVPLFLMMRGWAIPQIGFSFMDSRFGLILIYAAMGLPFSIFLLTGFFRSLPGELGEAAAIDGCGEFATFRKVYFPLAMPGITTAAIFNFLGTWNEYNFALVFITNPRLKTLPVGLYTLNVSQQYAANWPALFAGIVVLWAPTFLIFLLLQKQIIAGLTLGSVKG
jgi:N-acetylglucosamine transport system permease protein